MEALSAAEQQPMLFLLDASALSSSASPKSWEVYTASHHLDSSKRLLACYQCLRSHRPDARILTLLEADGFNQLITEWRGSQDTLTADIVSSLQCVPFGCRVTAFLIELAAQRVAKGYEVVVISNDVDIVVASRRGNTVKWRHLGFMFVDDEFLLPGLAQPPPSGPESAAAGCSAAPSSVGRRIPQASSPKTAPLRVQKSILKTQGGQGRSGTSIAKEARKKSPEHSDPMAVDECTGHGDEIEEVAREAEHAMQGMQPVQSPVPPSTTETVNLSQTDADAPDSAPKDMACNTFLYADTQLDAVMADMEESGLQPTIEQEGTAAQNPRETAADAEHASRIGAATTESPQDQERSNGKVQTDMLVSVNLQPEAAAAAAAAPEPPCARICTPLLEEDVALSTDVAKASEAMVVVEDEGAHVAINANGAGASQLEDPTTTSGGTSNAVSMDVDAAGSKHLPPVELSEVEQAQDNALPAPEPSTQQSQEATSPKPIDLPAAEEAASPEHIRAPAAEEACSFDVGVLLGNWTRDGGRRHVVGLNDAAGDSHEPGAIEFWPSGGGSTIKPILRTDGAWSLNGYTLVDALSTKDVLHWQHAGSGAVRTWWRPGPSAPSEGPKMPTVIATALEVTALNANQEGQNC